MRLGGSASGVLRCRERTTVLCNKLRDTGLRSVSVRGMRGRPPCSRSSTLQNPRRPAIKRRRQRRLRATNYPDIRNQGPARRRLRQHYSSKHLRALVTQVRSLCIRVMQQSNNNRQCRLMRCILATYKSGGRGGIRTHGTIARTPDFESGTFDHSATLPLH